MKTKQTKNQFSFKGVEMFSLSQYAFHSPLHLMIQKLITMRFYLES